MLHVLCGANVIVVIFKKEWYDEHVKYARLCFVIISFIQLAFYVLGMTFEMYLIYFTDDFMLLNIRFFWLVNFIGKIRSCLLKSTSVKYNFNLYYLV